MSNRSPIGTKMNDLHLTFV